MTCLDEATRRQVLAAAGAVILGGPLAIAAAQLEAEAHHVPGHVKKPRHRPGNNNDPYNCSGSPITISSGGTYSGCYVSTDPDVAAVDITTSSPVVISSAGIRSQGTLIEALPGVFPNLTIVDTIGVALNPGTAGRPPGRFLDCNEGTVRVQYNKLVGTGGMYMLGCTSTVVTNNDAVNIDGAAFHRLRLLDH